MAKATRSSVSSTSTKKRKRTEDDDSTETPPFKLPKSLDESHEESPVVIQAHDAEKILAVLEMIDTQGLLDRVFPLPSDEQKSYSFRTLLKDSSEHPLSVLQSAVQHLFPISSHPRARPSKPAAQQLRFCNLALSLLQQASTHSIQLPLDIESLLPSESEDDATPSSQHYQKPRYALVQHLPQGDYWTSLNSPSIPSDSAGRELKDLPHGHAELVAILPSHHPSEPLSSVPTLGSYHTKPIPSYLNKIPAQRRITRGSFLDYGPYTSFAPTFDQDGTEVGRKELGQIYFLRDAKRKEKENILRKWAARREKDPDVVMSENQVDDQVEEIADPNSSFNLNQELKELLPAHEVESLKASIQSLELELAVQELLDRNRKALLRLQELQYRRLMAEDGGSSTIQEGSEEWDTAQGIMDSLTLLASLRPRSSTGEQPPFVLTPSALHTLHRTLPLAPTSGWHGNLPPGRSTALRDDSTAKIRPGAPTPTIPVAAPVPTPAAASSSAIPSTSYNNYSYYQGQYRPTGTTTTNTTSYVVPKTGTTTTGYYQSYSQPTQQTGYYSYTQPYTSSATGHQPYSSQYSGWMNHYNPSGGATPTPVATSYSSFFGNSQSTTPRPSPAVANTVATAAGSKQGQWSASTPGTGLTLPLHLRPNGQAPQYTYAFSPQAQATGQATPASK
ncbi:hypothetical protein Moror_13185 [Moniliophthora roreri MCA 2997]|uniref:Uncharacterized protein n=1 Tax=Moniliophthora roreri (strain MCA 2997) TaxID=1381753 RepID=V2WQ29_MONRO|nr:hypothetical protein Moror_13185 [Moniliophthora roreri MCA 2997]